MKGYEILQEYERKFKEPIAYPFGIDESKIKVFEDIVLSCIQTGKRYNPNKHKRLFYPDDAKI